MKLKIRKAKEKDLKRIFEIEKRSYPPELQAPHKILRYRFETFGIWVAELNKKIVGFFTCVPIKLSWPKPDIKKILKNRNPYYKPWFDEYRKGGKFNTLYVTSTAVESRYQGKGIGKAMIKYSLRLAKKLGLSYRASVLRIPGYRDYYKKTKKSVKDYIKEVKAGKIKDRILNLYLKLGFELGEIIPNYEPDRSSLNYGIFAYKKIK
jgi:GNAT superfamily N-acetyltransferase